jgi:N6-adenosine-specific RNA methylase IME4
VLTGNRTRAKGGAAKSLSYSTMSVDQIANMPIRNLAEPGCHLWLWTTNQHLSDGFNVLKMWGFRYLAPIHWIKPSGIGNYFVHRTQTVLFGYREQCRFPMARYKPNILATSDPVRHSRKPEQFYELIEAISPGPRLELFARDCRAGWDSWGNEIDGVKLDLATPTTHLTFNNI